MIIVIMAQTVPSKDRHKKVMMEAVKEFVDQEATDRGISDNVLTRLGKSVVVKAVETALNSKLKVHDYYVANTTYVIIDGKEQMLSFGVLGIVFTFDKEMLHERLQQALESKEVILTEQQMAKRNAKELKALEKKKKKLEKQQAKERKKREKQALKEQKKREKIARKEQKRRKHEGTDSQH